MCGCRSRQGDRDLKVFANMLSGKTEFEYSEVPFAFCVRFIRQESYCTPLILLFEMNRNITQAEVAKRHPTEKRWMDCAEVDARPFLHYLQYLTYGGLGERDKQLHALGVFESYMLDLRNMLHMYHVETSLNLLGHCYEMEGNVNAALHYYQQSLLQGATNNPANWHVRRVSSLLSY
ncbi:hypothetical protein DPMN_046960 [Dreissena polymorpha]|uniref:Uncharacterized protein n=1 Tax=Dreissena polymorpha TaxID=45954 RepID=A0A9D4I131_DREPO|nr:hypothetical protein DPMN_046960 [Dreissena polymorpha]